MGKVGHIQVYLGKAAQVEYLESKNMREGRG